MGTGFLDEVQSTLRKKKYSNSTEKCYLDWIYRFILFHDNQHPLHLDEKDVSDFLTFLVCERKVAAATQNQALNAITFLYKEVLNIPLKDFHFNHLKVEERLPEVLTPNDVKCILGKLQGEKRLMTSLLYGCGLRLNECLELRIRSIDFDAKQLEIIGSEFNNGRKTILPKYLQETLVLQINKARIRYKRNLNFDDFAGVPLPAWLRSQTHDLSKREDWQYLFPARNMSKNRYTGKFFQHHRSVSFLQKAVKEAIMQAGVTPNSCCHSLRHSFATHLLESGYDIHLVKELIGHKDLRTTMLYTRIANRNINCIKSPLDLLMSGELK